LNGKLGRECPPKFFWDPKISLYALCHGSAFSQLTQPHQTEEAWDVHLSTGLESFLLIGRAPHGAKNIFNLDLPKPVQRRSLSGL
jgi:hypothetical protein